MRVIVCGSRTWGDRDCVWRRLDALYAEHGAALIVVHGDCPTGADRHARCWVQHMRLACALARKRELAPQEERHPAKWRVNGKLDKGAGFARNVEMARLGADICLAFRMPGKSNGTDHMREQAIAARIPDELHVETLHWLCAHGPYRDPRTGKRYSVGVAVEFIGTRIVAAPPWAMSRIRARKLHDVRRFRRVAEASGLTCTVFRGHRGPCCFDEVAA